jgi:hypothetical protein
MFQTTSEVNTISTGHKHHLHRLVADLTVCQKGVCCAGIKLHKKFALKIKCIPTNKVALEEFF